MLDSVLYKQSLSVRDLFSSAENFTFISNRPITAWLICFCCALLENNVFYGMCRIRCAGGYTECGLSGQESGFRFLCLSIEYYSRTPSDRAKFHFAPAGLFGQY